MVDKKTMSEKKKRMIFAPMAGICEAFVMQPIDTIKVRQQSNQYPGLKKFVQKKGVQYLYKGLTPFTAQMCVKYGIRFSSFELLRGNNNNFYSNLVAGIGAGFFESLFITPFEIIKTNLQTRDSLTDPLAASKRITADGISGLYRGFWSTCLRQSINQGSNFTAYMMMRDYIIKKDEKPNIFKVMFSALISGSIGPILNNPFDVIKTRYMNPKYNEAYSSIPDAIKKIIKKEGITTLWKGIHLRVFRVATGQAITFSVIEQLSYLSTKYNLL